MVIIFITILFFILLIIFLYGLIYVKEEVAKGLICMFISVFISINLLYSFNLKFYETYRTINPSEIIVDITLNNGTVILSDTASLYIYQYSMYIFD